MLQLQFPEPQFKVKEDNGKHYIFDIIRKDWIILTDEEWVRQNFINYIISILNYPSTLIAVEKEIKLHDLKKRFDILIYDKMHKPWMMIECKAAEVELNEETLQQVLRYNISVPAQYIIITNGERTLGWKKENNQLTMIKEMPKWDN